MTEESFTQDGVGEPDDLERLWTPHRMAYIKGENKPTDPSSGALDLALGLGSQLRARAAPVAAVEPPDVLAPDGAKRRADEVDPIAAGRHGGKDM